MKRFFLMALFLAVGTLRAEPPSAEIRHKSRDLEKVKAELGRKRDETEQLKREAEELSSDLKKTESRIDQIEQSLGATRNKTREIAQKIATTKNEHDRLLQEVDQNKSTLQDTANRYYVASALLGPSDINTVYSRQLVLGQSQALHGTQARQQTMHTTLDELTDTGQTLRREMGRQEDVLTEARSGQANKEKLLEKKKTRAQAVQAELKGLEQTSQELASLIDILRSKARQEKEEQKRERAANQKSGRSPIAAKSLAWPMRGTIAEKFGRQREQESGGAYISNGILITARAATMVKAVAAGTVLYAGQFMRYGSMVLVEHPGDWYSVYGHLNQWAVEKGQVVKEGDPIGGTGVRGDGLNETYFELRFYGKPVDPLPWLEP